METHKGSGSPASTDPVPYAASGLPGQVHHAFVYSVFAVLKEYSNLVIHK